MEGHNHDAKSKDAKYIVTQSPAPLPSPPPRSPASLRRPISPPQPLPHPPRHPSQSLPKLGSSLFQPRPVEFQFSTNLSSSLSELSYQLSARPQARRPDSDPISPSTGPPSAARSGGPTRPNYQQAHSLPSNSLQQRRSSRSEPLGQLGEGNESAVKKTKHPCVYCTRSDRPCTQCIIRNIDDLCGDESRERGLSTLDNPDSKAGILDVYTDSGYDSRRADTVNCDTEENLDAVEKFSEQVALDKSSSVDFATYENTDVEPLYSGIWSPPDPRTPGIVFSFVADLCNALSADFGRSKIELICTALPYVLKAFAFKIRSESPGRIARQVSNLVRQYRDEITRSVRRRPEARWVDSLEDDEQLGIQTDTGSSMNERGSGESGWLVEHEEEHESMQDHEVSPIHYDDWVENELPTLSACRQLFSQSPAYKWLLSSLQTECSLTTPGPVDTRRDIRNRIVDVCHRLGTSGRGDSHEIKMRFLVDWDPFSFIEDQQYDQPIEEVLAHVLTITGHGNNVQTISCLEYMGQTWPETGPPLLRFLQTTLTEEAQPRHEAPEVLLSGTRLVAQYNGAMNRPRLVLEATGDPFSVAEVGEQLAWVSAALRTSTEAERVASCTPFIESLTLEEKPAEASSATKLLQGVCSFNFQLRNTVGVISGIPGSCWQKLFRNPVVVTGYPIPRRLLSDGGLQTSVDIAAALINSRRLIRFASMTFIKGFSAMLLATKVVGDTVYWHLLYNADGSYISYEDIRIHRSSKFSETLTLDFLERGRHIVGWCEQIKNITGTRDANYDVGWSGLPDPGPTCAFDKVSISGGQFIPAAVSCVLGLRDKPLHITFGDDYLGMLMTIADRYFVLYDRDERVAWLVDGASALLHLLRASLTHYRNDPRLRTLLCPQNTQLEEAQATGMASHAAFEVLSNINNQNIPLYPKKKEAWEERTTKLGKGKEHEDVAKEKTSYFCVRDRIEHLCHILCQITAHQDDTHTQGGVGFRLRSTPRRQLEGFDFMDVATNQGTLWPKLAALKATGQGWVDFARAIHAPVLFGVGFGQLFVPVGKPCGSCLLNSPVPAGKDYLAVCVAELRDILRKKGSMRVKPWRLVNNIHWYTPDQAFEPCVCSYGRHFAPRHDRVQVLLPATFPRLWVRCLRSPQKLAANGAVIFGHSWKFPLRWCDKNTEPPEEGDPGPSVDEVDRLFDSGIGMTDNSSTGKTSDWRSSASPGRQDDATESNTPSGSSSDDTTVGLYGMENRQFISQRNDTLKHYSDGGPDTSQEDSKRRKIKNRI